MAVYEAPDDEDDHGPRQSYNFAPGYNGLVYRADVPDWGAGPKGQGSGEEQGDGSGGSHGLEKEPEVVQTEGSHEIRYKLQSMKWGKHYPTSHCSSANFNQD